MRVSGGHSTALQGGPGAAGMRRPACCLMEYLNRLRAWHAYWIDRLAQWITPEDIRKSDKACTDISAEINREQDRIASQRKPK